MAPLGAVQAAVRGAGGGRWRLDHPSRGPTNADTGLGAARGGVFAWLRTQAEADAALSEGDVQAEFGRLMRAEGLEVPAHDEPLCAVNGNAGVPHYSPTDERHSPVRRGDVLLLDFSAALVGAGNVIADYTWMTYLGERVPERVAELFTIVRDARDLRLAVLRQRFEAGRRVEGYEVDDAVRAFITDAGYGDAFIHRTGHNIGTAVHGKGAHLQNFTPHHTRPPLTNTRT